MFKLSLGRLRSLKNIKISPLFSLQNLFKFPQFAFCSNNVTISSTLAKTSELRAYMPLTVGNLKDNDGARLPRTRVGRGPGSGKGKTCGRGHKGFKARVGNINRHYEGGQTPLTRRLPKHGFRRKGTRENFNYINLDRVVYLILKGRLDATQLITMKELYWSGGISKIKNGVKLLSRGAEGLKDLPPINIEVSSASQRAIDEIKNCGGTVNVAHKTPLTLRYLTKPWKFIREPLEPIPKFKKVVRLLNQEEKGAIVHFKKPDWMRTIDLNKREVTFKKKIDSMKNAHLLPEYPVKITPHMSDNVIRERKPKLFRKYNFDPKN